LAANSSEADLQLVTFLLDGEEYAIDVMAVREIISMTDITKTVNCARHVEGVIDLRGSIVPIISLRKRLGLAECDDVFSSIAVLDFAGELTGFIIDQVSDVIRVNSGEILPPLVGASHPWIAGILNLDRLVIVMNLEHLS
jgi:purine-binding chemotaxis protein CheW